MQWQKPETFTCTFSTTELSSMPYNIFLYIPQWWKQHKEMKIIWVWLRPTPLCSSTDQFGSKLCTDTEPGAAGADDFSMRILFLFLLVVWGISPLKTSDHSPLLFALFNHSRLYSGSVRRHAAQSYQPPSQMGFLLKWSHIYQWKWLLWGGTMFCSIKCKQDGVVWQRLNKDAWKFLSLFLYFSITVVNISSHSLSSLKLISYLHLMTPPPPPSSLSSPLPSHCPCNFSTPQ